MLLAIDTSTRNASIALSEGRWSVATLAWYSTVNHSAELMPAVAQLLGRSGLRSRDLEAVAVALGPGGFSALRTGLSVAKGLAMASGIPIVGVGSLDLEAHPFREAGLPVCALLEAGRGEAASALIGADGVRFREDRITGPDELLDEIEVIVPEAPLLLCGEGLPAWSDSLRQRMGSSAVVCYAPPSGRAVALADLASQRLERGDADELDSLQPNYIRMPSIGTPKRRDRRVQASSRRAPQKAGGSD